MARAVILLSLASFCVADEDARYKLFKAEQQHVDHLNHLNGNASRNASKCGHGTCNIVNLVLFTPDLDILGSALVAAALAGTLLDPGPFTLFAPTDKAFQALPAGTLHRLMQPEHKKELVDILTFHVLPEEVLSKDLNGANDLPTVAGKNLYVERIQNSVLLNVGELTPASVIKADILASNGVIHIIDNVLIPPKCTPPFSGGCPPSPAPPGKNIVQLAESVPDLSTLVAAVVASDFVLTLSAGYECTVFAPTNDAFLALPPGTLDRLMKPEHKKELVDIISYHVVSNKLKSKDLQPFQAITTFENKPLHVVKWGDRVRVGASLESKDLKNVIKADNVANNGVVHIIDGVLLPPSSAILV